MNYKEIYTGAFNIDRYSRREDTPRYSKVMDSILAYKPKTLLDIGAGRGQIERAIKAAGLDTKISVADLDNFTKEDVEFFRIDLSHFTHKDICKTFDVIICIDVLEHIEPQYLPLIINEISLLAPLAFISTANHSNVEIINGEPVELHLVQEPIEYWIKLLEPSFNILKAEEILQNRSFYFECQAKELTND